MAQRCLQFAFCFDIERHWLNIVIYKHPELSDNLVHFDSPTKRRLLGYYTFTQDLIIFPRYSGFLFVTDSSSMFCGKTCLALALIGLVSTTTIANPVPMYAVTDIARVVLDTMTHKAEENAREKTNRPPPPPRPQPPPEPTKSDEEKRDRAEKLGRQRKWSFILE